MDVFAKGSVYIHVRIYIFVYAHTFDVYFSHVRPFVPVLCVSHTYIQVNSGELIMDVFVKGSVGLLDEDNKKEFIATIADGLQIPCVTVLSLVYFFFPPLFFP